MDRINAYKTITFNEMRSYMADHSAKTVILDVRNADEYQEGHADGSILLPLWEFEDKIDEVVSDKDSRVFVYCASGVRSESAAEILVKHGYANVYNVEGYKYWE